MKAIMVMFDSLNRRTLEPYGCDWVKTPNFRRLSGRTVTFDNCYAGSMPCMPARRELHTGRYNFLHRSWGPIEPFDDSMPEILKNSGIYTHLISDHYHYWEDGGATYHNRYNTWEIVRGQEGDKWKGVVRDPETPENINRPWRHDWVNREHMRSETDMPQARTFALGEEFILKNRGDDNWFLQIETFDPHEPFFTQQHWKELYPHEYRGPLFDWPSYRRVTETPDQVRHVRYEYAALVSMCDHYLGRIMALMDELDLWNDTLLIVNTDHGYLLGEHDWWAKCVQPMYDEVVHNPLFIWDPRCRKAGERRRSLVQTHDLAPTLLQFFGVPIPKDMLGLPLTAAIERDEPVRRAALFGMHGVHVNCTDGRYVYMRGPESMDSQPVYNYTLMPTHMRKPFPVSELQGATLREPFSFTKGCKTLRVQSPGGMPGGEPMERPPDTMLFDLAKDPRQQRPMKDGRIEQRMIEHMVKLMQEHDAPAELYRRLGVDR
ncbi:MAG: sulfatase [Spirochaetales bacterium]|nr:sulfatase [Spirochaetales bacterium]